MKSIVKEIALCVVDNGLTKKAENINPDGSIN